MFLNSKIIRDRLSVSNKNKICMKKTDIGSCNFWGGTSRFAGCYIKILQKKEAEFKFGWILQVVIFLGKSSPSLGYIAAECILGHILGCFDLNSIVGREQKPQLRLISARCSRFGFCTSTSFKGVAILSTVVVGSSSPILFPTQVAFICASLVLASNLNG